MAEEVGRRTIARDDARLRAQTHDSARISAEREHGELTAKLQKLSAERQLRRDDYQNIKSRLDQVGREIARLESDLRESLAELPEAFQTRIAMLGPGDWEQTSFPTSRDLASLEQSVASLDAARRQFEKLADMNVAAEPKRARLDAIHKTIDDLTSQLPMPADDLRKCDIRTRADTEALAGRIAARRSQLGELEKEIERMMRDHGRLQAAASELASHLSAENARLVLRRKALADALRALPDDWRPLVDRAKLADQHAWKSERNALIGRSAAQRTDDLRIAKGMVAELQANEAETAKLIDAIPSASRRPATEIQKSIHDAKKAAESGDVTVRAAQAALQELEHRLRQRQSLVEQSLALDLAHARHFKLAELLSRDRLQGTLIRRAERQIVEQANIILDRLSDGRLLLQIRGGGEPENAARSRIDQSGRGRVGDSRGFLERFAALSRGRQSRASASAVTPAASTGRSSRSSSTRDSAVSIATADTR